MIMVEGVDLERTNNLLKEALLKQLRKPGRIEAAELGFRMNRAEEATEVSCHVLEPLVAAIVQGKKRSLYGSQEIRYGEKQCIVTGVEFPNAAQIVEASPAKPYLSVSLLLDPVIIAELLTAMPAAELAGGVHKGLTVAASDPAVLDAFLRLADTVSDPVRQSVLAPMIIREIHYRLLSGPFGNQLKMIHTDGSQSNQVAQAVTWLKEHYNEPFDVGELARQSNMAASTFHRQFRQLTTLSPLQYQKRLRLYEAQRLMLAEHKDASTAGYSVGYESLTQFNREYKRMFGAPPRQDVRRILAG
jgi:AraC-like DNA-binding protein